MVGKNVGWIRIRHLLRIGLIAALIATTGDMILGWGVYDEGLDGLAFALSLYQDVSDGRLLASELLGAVGMAVELLCLFAVYRLMMDAAPRIAHAYRAGILGCTIFGVCGYHVSFLGMFFTYKNAMATVGAEEALAFLTRYAGYFVVPSVALFFVFLLVLTIAQIMAFAKGLTPYPKWCGCFSLLLGACVVYAVCGAIGNYPLANALGTAWLHVGAAYLYLGLLATIPCKKAELAANTAT